MIIIMLLGGGVIFRIFLYPLQSTFDTMIVRL